MSIRTSHPGRKCTTDESRTITCRKIDRAEEGGRVTGRALMQVQIMASRYHKKKEEAARVVRVAECEQPHAVSTLRCDLYSCALENL